MEAGRIHHQWPEGGNAMKFDWKSTIIWSVILTVAINVVLRMFC